MDIQEILNQGNYHLIDVREPEELIANGAIEGAENIPLGEVENHADEIAKLDGNVIFFCRSGNRSGKATEARVSFCLSVSLVYYRNSFF